MNFRFHCPLVHLPLVEKGPPLDALVGTLVGWNQLGNVNQSLTVGAWDHIAPNNLTVLCASLSRLEWGMTWGSPGSQTCLVHFVL